MFVPFASFIYFSHAENFFMNRAVNRIPDVNEFATHELQVPTVVPYPGDHWEVDAPRDSSESIRRYEVDLSRALAAPPETSPSIPITRLQLAADAFIRKSRRDPRDSATHRGHVPDELVTGHEGVLDRAVPGPDAIVRPADARRPHPDENLPRPGLGDRPVLYSERPRSVEHRRLHANPRLPVRPVSRRRGRG